MSIDTTMKVPAMTIAIPMTVLVTVVEFLLSVRFGSTAFAAGTGANMASASLVPVRLRCECLVNPLGIDTRLPRPAAYPASRRSLAGPRV